MTIQENMKSALRKCRGHPNENRMKVLLILYIAGVALRKKHIVAELRRYGVKPRGAINIPNLVTGRGGQDYAYNYRSEGWKISPSGVEEVKKFLKEKNIVLKEEERDDAEGEVKKEGVAIPSNVDSNQVFIASWFNEEMKEPIKNGIKRAVLDMGYDPFDMNEYYPTRSDDRISSEIEKQINKSKFVIADTTYGEATGYRPSVYYEAGYAQGSIREVILTSKKRCTPSFNTGQLKHIFWSNSNQLYKDLCGEIEARYGKGSNNTNTKSPKKHFRRGMPLGKKIKSDNECKRHGHWQADSSPPTTAEFKYGEVLPKCNGKKSTWTLIEYID